jgi:hypothetical protein
MTLVLAVICKKMSGLAETELVSVALLFPGTGSTYIAGNVTVAELLMLPPAAVTVAGIVNVTVA